MAKDKKLAEEAEDSIKAEETEDVTEHEDHGDDVLVAKHRDISGDNAFTRLKHWYGSHKKISIPLTIVIVVLVLLAVPFTRYKVLGMFMQKNYTVTVLDIDSGKPISSADISLASKTAKTNEKGEATINDAPLGKQKVTVTKKYYKDLSANVTVDLSDAKNKSELKLEATGRQIPIAVTNKITGKGIKGAKVTVLDSEAQTDEKGEATVVVPVDKKTEKVTIKLDGYNNLTADINVSDQVSEPIKVSLVPTGKLFFLSKQSGKIDVVKTDLDGSKREIVLAGTGKEEDTGTILLASRDWKYLALKSRRDGGRPKLYFIETASGKLSTMDEGEAEFTPVGWQDEHFVYQVLRTNLRPEQPRYEGLKGFNAVTQKLTALDDLQSETGNGVGVESYSGQPYLVDGELVFAKNWRFVGAVLPGKQSGIFAIKPDGQGKRTVQSVETFPRTYIQSRLYKSNELYFRLTSDRNTPTQYFEYEDKKFAPVNNVNDETFFKDYPTYLLSPSGQATFWPESRDGKNTLFLGNTDGDESKEIASLSEFLPYGWYTDEYLLVSKKGSELYIMSKDKGMTPLKVSDYHKPASSFYGYGGGYGGL